MTNLDTNILLANLEIAQKRIAGASARLKQAKSPSLISHAKKSLEIACTQLAYAEQAMKEA